MVTRIYKAIDYRRSPVFKFVTDEVIAARRAANQASTDRVAIAKSNVAKLIGNSSYGGYTTTTKILCMSLLFYIY